MDLSYQRMGRTKGQCVSVFTRVRDLVRYVYCTTGPVDEWAYWRHVVWPIVVGIYVLSHLVGV